MVPDRLPDKLRVAVGAVLTPEQAQLLADGDPRLEVLYDPAFMPPQDYPGDVFAPPGWHLPEAEQARFEAMCASADALFGIPQDRPSLLRKVAEADPHLIWVHTMAAGGGGQVRAAKLSPADLSRITVTTGAGIHALPLAEFAVFGAMVAAKEYAWLKEQQQAHRWGQRHPMRHLFEMTVVVVGMGGIGRAVAERFGQFGATVIGVNRSAKDVPGVEMHLDADLAQVVARADVLVNCLPAAVGTDNLISADVLAAAKPGCTVVSVGRGTCLDEAALAEQLASGHLGFAALDVTAAEPLVPDSPLWDMPNVLISPHIAGLSTSEVNRTIALFLDNAARLLEGRPLRNVMNKELFY